MLIVEARMNIYVKPHNDFAAYLLRIAGKWQKRWIEEGAFEADPEEGRPKFFLTAAFPYPNGPSHMGHARAYTVTDVYARYKRMKGYNVLFPMAFHYTGTPVLAMAEALKRGDEALRRLFLKVYGVPEEVLEDLTDPLTMARYFHEISRTSMIESGYSIDWRREFTTIDPEFNSFIRWQFAKLREKGFLVKGSHPVGWCPNHEMPVGMHDTKDDKEPEIGEWTLLFFIDDEGRVYPAATLRPETVFGVTNMWANPDVEYVEAEVNGRTWILSREAAEKLKFQKSVRVKRSLRGSELLGRRVRNPVTGERVAFLPASFVDPAVGTGIVMSVPAHAPYDYAAIVDLDEETMRRYGVDREELRPRPLIVVEGYGETPAVEIVERMGIRSQGEVEKLEEATKEIYGAEYKHGVMRGDIVGYAAQDVEGPAKSYILGFIKAWVAGRPVREARENLVRWLKGSELADSMYEIMNRPVYCRCGAEVVVKILEDQWFIDYGNPRWKELARKALENMRILPPEYRGDFKYTIEWVDRKACARTRGMGTELPWAKGWIIESLSDSTIYMAFYTVAHKLRGYGIKAEQLTLEFWDYIMLGRGDPSEVSEKTGVPVEVLEELRREFDYWYPLDSRHSGKDLIPNHLTFFIYNHVAVFPEDKWPRQIAVNGWVLLRGHKMSKSLGNVIPLRIMNHLYGPDTVRAAVILSAEVGQDADFTDELVESVLDRLKRIHETILGLGEIASRAPKTPGELTQADRWMLSRLQRHIENATRSMEELKLREAANTIFYLLDRDVRRYLERVEDEMEEPGRKETIAWVVSRIVDAWIRMLSPITPHLAEELWSSTGGEGLVSTAKWPEVDESLIDEDVEVSEEYVDRVVEDVREIVRVLGKAPKRIVFYVADPEEYRYLSAAIEHVDEGRPLRDYIRSVVAGSANPKELARRAKKYYEQATKLPPRLRSFLRERTLNEQAILEASKGYIMKALNVGEIEVYRASDPEAPDLAGKKAQALPFKPAIYIE